MKKLLLLLVLLITSIDFYCETIIYIVFTSTSSEEGVQKRSSQNLEFEGETNYLFMLNSKKHDYWFAYGHRKSEAFNSEVIIKPYSFLKSVKFIDWDSKKNSLPKADIAELIKKINAHDKIYFIDRNDFKGDSIQLIRVRPLRYPD